MEVKVESIYQLGLSFFGLTSETAPLYRVNLFTQIHEMVFHGKGGYDWETIYNMPRWLRQFTFNQINEYYKKESEAYEKAQNKGGNKSTLVDPSGKVNKEAFKEACDTDNLDKIRRINEWYPLVVQQYSRTMFPHYCFDGRDDEIFDW